MNEADIVRLQTLDCSKLKPFSFEGFSGYAKVVSVHDTDTITVAFFWKDTPIKINIRLSEIDAPELRSSVKCESDACKLGRDALIKLILNKVVIIHLKKFDKYGRTLAEVHATQPIVDHTCINRYLIDYCYARPYDGGSKQQWTAEELAMTGSRRKCTKK